MATNRKIAICIPVHSMDNAPYFFTRCLDSIISQTYDNFEVFIADNSDDDVLYKISQTYGMKITWIKNPIKGACVNTNEAIKGAKGEIIKILYADDLFAHKNALQVIADAWKGGWLVTGCYHTTGKDRINPHLAMYNDKIHTGNNTIGSPSVLSFENNNPYLFDEDSVWLFDCDLYKRLHKRYGMPTVLNDFNVVIGIGSHQMTEKISQGRKDEEVSIMTKRYDNH